MPKKYRATLFTNGGSQAVRLPKECRLDGKVVEVWREGSRVVIESVEKPSWPPGYWDEIKRNPLPDDFEIPVQEPDQPERAIGWYDLAPES